MAPAIPLDLADRPGGTFVSDGNRKWADREFDFEFLAETLPSLLARLRATANRLTVLIGPLPRPVLARREGESWSIQENAGHLGDTDELFIRRLAEYREGAKELSPAEMSGRKTFAAGHNDREVYDLLDRFRRKREAYVASIEELPDEIFERTAFHPRLTKQMRLRDLLHFQAEHDTYHIRRIEELIERFAKR